VTSARLLVLFPHNLSQCLIWSFLVAGLEIDRTMNKIILILIALFALAVLATVASYGFMIMWGIMMRFWWLLVGVVLGAFLIKVLR